MKQSLEQALDDLDVMVFTGNSLHNDESRKAIKESVKRWLRARKEFEDSIDPHQKLANKLGIPRCKAKEINCQTFQIKDLTDMSSEDLRDIIDISREIILDRTKLQIRTGSTVSFDHKGFPLEGTVLKKNPTRAKVKTSAGIWNCPYSMLTFIK